MLILKSTFSTCNGAMSTIEICSTLWTVLLRTSHSEHQKPLKRRSSVETGCSECVSKNSLQWFPTFSV
uniref:ATR n=1 Tax=Arundo donax TaxID=35708 RepID=A0A0A9U4V8_ARUDO